MKYKPQWQIDEEDFEEMIKGKREFKQLQRRLLIANEQSLSPKSDYYFNKKYNKWVAIK